ncbi:MAG: TIGR01777 family oxidoreductase [Oleispira sp.]
MRFLITGGTGFIGSALCEYLLKGNHSIMIQTRHPELVKGEFESVKRLEELSANEAFDVVINLTGEPIANKRWSVSQKKKILESRLNTTQKIIDFLKNAKQKPRLFISGSAIGFYGVDSSTGSENDAIAEDVTLGGKNLGDDSFSSRLCKQWEASALQAESLGIRTCLLRTGIVLGSGGGALAKMTLPFKLGLGGKIGSGKQWMPWIHLDDLIGIIDYCIHQETITGPINGTAPNPVTNAEFTIALGRAVKRPALLPMPACVVKLLMGEMGEELLLAGKKVLPMKAQQAGYQFKYEHLESALADIL